MKYTLECNEDEEKTFRLHLDGVKWALAMWDLDQQLYGQRPPQPRRSEHQLPRRPPRKQARPDQNLRPHTPLHRRRARPLPTPFHRNPRPRSSPRTAPPI